MMQKNTFFLCEKPSQARVLAKALGVYTQDADGMYVGSGITVGFAHGHLMNLAMPDAYIGADKWKLSGLPILPQKWMWEVAEHGREQYDRIGARLRQANAVVIATDPDEEGEVIGRQILLGHGYRGKVSRLWASALDPQSLDKALRNLLPLSATDTYYNAGRIRRELDWLFGMNLSRAFSVKFDRTTHVGRVKTRLLGELVKRDNEIAAFAPEKRLTARAFIGDAVLEWQPGMGAVHDAAGLNALCSRNTLVGTCLSVETGTEQLAPPLPYTLSALLADAADLGIPLAVGYAVTQKLYEAGAISYPRTSSTALPGQDADFAAHHAIINTMDTCPAWIPPDGVSIFNLVRLNGVQQQIGSATVDVRRLTFDFGGEVFSVTDRWVQTKNAAWLACVPERYDAMLANAKTDTFGKGQKVKAHVCVEQIEAIPPAPYTEASLLRMMAKECIGTEATRIDAIGTLVRERVADMSELVDERGFALKKSLLLRSTRVGRNLHAHLPEDVTGPAMEAQMKKALDAVRGGQPDLSVQLLEATKWVARTIHSTTCA